MRRSKTLCRLTIAMASVLWLSSPAIVRCEELDRAKLLKAKAALVYKFAKFVRWPEGTFADDDAPFVIGLVGDDPFGRILDDTVKGKKINDRTIQLRRFDWSKPEDRTGLKECHALFISESEKNWLGRILAALDAHPVLLISDMREFAANGGMIGIVLEKGRLVFEINHEVMERVKVVPRGKLLKLARIVKSKGRRGGN